MSVALVVYPILGRCSACGKPDKEPPQSALRITIQVSAAQTTAQAVAGLAPVREIVTTWPDR